MYANTVIFFISQEKFNLFIVISWKRTVNPILTCLPLYLKKVVHKMWVGYFTDNMQLYLSKMLCASFFIVNIINQIKYCGGWGVYSLWYRACKKKELWEPLPYNEFYHKTNTLWLCKHNCAPTTCVVYTEQQLQMQESRHKECQHIKTDVSYA